MIYQDAMNQIDAARAKKFNAIDKKLKQAMMECPSAYLPVKVEAFTRVRVSPTVIRRRRHEVRRACC